MVKKLSVDRPAGESEIIEAGQALVVFTSNIPGNAATDIGRRTSVSVASKNVEVVTWGDKNDLPQYRESLVVNNQIVPSLMKRKRDIICGQNFYAYLEQYDDNGNRNIREASMPPMAEAFFRVFRNMAPDIIADALKHETSFVEFVVNRDGSLNAMQSLEAKYMRAAPKAGGRINTWYWSNAWTNTMRKALNNQGEMLDSIPVFNPTKKQAKYLIVNTDMMFNDGYYPIPSWWGSRHWIELANVIPLFHAANLRNMSAPRWVLVIPHDYFTDYEALNAATTEEERAKLRASEKAARQSFIDDFNSLVTGVENSGRTLTVQSIQEEVMGKIVDKRIHIEPLIIDLRDEALLKLYDASNVANTSAQGLHPTLANIETQGRLSSGSEIRNAYLLWLVIAAPYYRSILEGIVEHARERGWIEREFRYAIRDAELTTLADNPAGVRPAQTQVGK